MANQAADPSRPSRGLPASTTAFHSASAPAPAPDPAVARDATPDAAARDAAARDAAPGAPRPPAEGAPPGRGAIVDWADVAALRLILEGTARTTGEAFFQSLVRHLAAAIDVSHAFVAEFTEVETRVRTLAYWSNGKFQENLEFDLAGTPCEQVLRGAFCHHPRDVRGRFPLDAGLAMQRTESYLGVPLCDADGDLMGHLAVFDPRPMSSEPRRLYVFSIFAERAAAELERLRAERRLADSERRFRDLYEDAPSAYVSLDSADRFLSVNRRAAELLGMTPAELLGRPLADFAADSPAGREALAAALARFHAGDEPAGVELELRRRDGRPLWAAVWMQRAAPSGKNDPVAARSIWIDVTARVLMEAEKHRLHQQNLYLQEEIKAEHNFEEIVGRSPRLTAVLDHIERVAPTDSTVLVYGETGVGKELAARAIHSLSRRRDKPLIKINCAALPEGLVESELFGHEKGAFTGAVARRLGRFELAHGGTIFLDEIGELPPDAQAKLLRVLQEREFERVGGGAPIKVDVRVVAATNRDLRAAVKEKTFREDLYYRLSVFPLELPPLRERTGDVPLLVHFLVAKFSARIGKRIEGVDPATMERLSRYAWPGNVRELENVLERAVILSSGPILRIDPEVLQLPPPAPPHPPQAEAEPPAASAPLEGAGLGSSALGKTALGNAALGKTSLGKTALAEVEREHFLAVLRTTAWKIEGETGAAKLLGMHPNTLRSRLKKLGIQRPGGEPA